MDSIDPITTKLKIPIRNNRLIVKPWDPVITKITEDELLMLACHGALAFKHGINLVRNNSKETLSTNFVEKFLERFASTPTPGEVVQSLSIDFSYQGYGKNSANEPPDMNANFCKKKTTASDDSRWLSVYEVTNTAKNDKLKVQIWKCPPNPAWPLNPNKLKALLIEKIESTTPPPSGSSSIASTGKSVVDSAPSQSQQLMPSCSSRSKSPQKAMSMDARIASFKVDLKQQVAKGYINTPCGPKKYDSPTKKAVNTLLTEMKAATGKEGNIRMSFARIVAKFMVYKLPHEWTVKKDYLRDAAILMSAITTENGNHFTITIDEDEDSVNVSIPN